MMSENAEEAWLQLRARNGDDLSSKDLRVRLSAWGPEAQLPPSLSDEYQGHQFQVAESHNGVTLTLFEGVLPPTSTVRAVEVNGLRGVAKLSKRTEEALSWELELVAYLAELGLAPRIIPTTEGLAHSGSLFVMEWVAGDVDSASNASDNWRELEVAALTKIHEATQGWPQCPGLASSRELLESNAAGQIELNGMPNDVLHLCREAWARLPDLPLCAVHGDPGAPNVVVTSVNTAIMLDWAWARVDHPWFDLAHAPESLSCLTQDNRMKAVCADLGWQVASDWESDRNWAENRLSVLRKLMATRL